MEFQKQNTFKPPPKEWINHRLERFYETLNKNTTASALALKELLGPIKLESVTESSFNDEIAALPSVTRNDYLFNEIAMPPVVARNDRLPSNLRINPKNDNNGEKEFKSYYIAHTKIQTLALLDDKYKGSN